MHDRGLNRVADLASDAEDWAVEIVPCCGRYPWKCDCDNAREMLASMSELGYTLEVDAEELPIVRW